MVVMNILIYPIPMYGYVAYTCILMNRENLMLIRSELSDYLNEHPDGAKTKINTKNSASVY